MILLCKNRFRKGILCKFEPIFYGLSSLGIYRVGRLNRWCCTLATSIELMINKTHGLSPPGGLVSPSGGFASLLFDQVQGISLQSG